MKGISKILAGIMLLGGVVATSAPARAFDWLRAASGGIKLVQSLTISDSQVRSYVHQYITDLDKKSNVAPDNSPYTIRLKKLTQGLTMADDVPLNFKVYITKDVNAFACADGSVRVYSGLMDLMSDDEVMGVIGHEVGHVAHKHTKKAMKQALLTSAVREGLASGSGWVATLSASQLGAIGEALLGSKYSKSQEDDADNYGYQFLKKSGKNPWAMAQAFSKLRSMEGKTGGFQGAVNNLFSDHPSTEKRIKKMEAKARADKYPVPAGYTPLTK